MKRLVIACTIALGVILACKTTNEVSGPTEVLDEVAPITVPGPSSPDNDSTGVVEDAPRQAKGRYALNGTVFECRQSTDYRPDVLAVFTVLEGGNQDGPRVYKAAWGDLEEYCGELIQADCLVRNSAKSPTARPSAYDLYAAFIGVIGCPEKPKCTVNCGPPCEGEWEADEPGVTFEGECEQRVKVTRTVYTHPCKDYERVEVTRERAPEECSSDECVYPESGSGELDLPNANPETECGAFGLVPKSGGAFSVTKCGQFYQWGLGSPPNSICSNGQDISHIRECDCPEDD
jgi:hypothetical protein